MRELSLHILDLTQNAIEAGATEVSVELEENSSQDLFLIRVTDNGRGMDEETLKKVRDPFVTSRHTRKIGLGLPLIEMSTRMTGGSLAIESACGRGTVVTAVYRHSHLDRPPLGHIQDTLINLLVANPKLVFYFSHQVNERCFEFSSLAVFQAVGDVPLTQPDVLAWLREYLKEQYYRLYGGVNNENT